MPSKLRDLQLILSAHGLVRGSFAWLVKLEANKAEVTPRNTIISSVAL